MALGSSSRESMLPREQGWQEPVGAGLFVPSAIAIVLMLISLGVLGTFKRRFFPAEWIKTINLYFSYKIEMEGNIGAEESP
jgi:hypothetical protein